MKSRPGFPSELRVLKSDHTAQVEASPYILVAGNLAMALDIRYRILIFSKSISLKM